MKKYLQLCVCVASLLTGPLAATAAPFPTSYEEARSDFRRNTESSGIFQSSKINIPNRANDDLTIDLAFAPATGARKKLVVVSTGVHGVEGPAGSVVLKELLSSCTADLDRSHTGIVLIHAMNPYGYKHSRRFNESNVDLNRNCFDHKTKFPGASLPNPAYEKIKAMYHRDSFTSMPKVLLGLATHMSGEATIVASLAGQYTYPEGIYYGGKRVETECAKTEDFLDHAAEGYGSILHLDIHTGLGTFGLNQIMVNGPVSDSDYMAFESLFPDKSKTNYELKRSDGTDTTINNHGDFSRYLCDSVPERKCLAATAEMGALGGLTTLIAIINENVAYQFPERFSATDKFNARQSLRDVFTPRNNVWRDKVRASAKSLCEAIRKFAKD